MQKKQNNTHQFLIHIVSLNQFSLLVYPTVVRFKWLKCHGRLCWVHLSEPRRSLWLLLYPPHRVACEKGLCRPQLSVITGRGNHSQGGVARIRPAVINYLTNAHYRLGTHGGEGMHDSHTSCSSLRAFLSPPPPPRLFSGSPNPSQASF